MQVRLIFTMLSISGIIAFGASLDPALLIETADVCALNTHASACANGGPPVQTGGFVTYSGTETLPSGVTVTGTGFGEAEDYGVLRASAAASSFNISGSPQSVQVLGVSAFRDIVTVNFAPWKGSPGLLYVNYTLSGTVSTSGVAVAGVNIETYGGPTDSQMMSQTYLGSESGIFAAPQPIHFVYGQPFNLGLELWTTVGTVDPNSLFSTTMTTGSGAGSADFSNTLVLSGLTPTDMNGVEAAGAQFSSASGTPYTVNGVLGVAPESSSALLMLLGSSLGLAVLFRNGRSLGKDR
jgi:hypothetical protein